MKEILISGGNSKFAQELMFASTGKYNITRLSKDILNVCNLKQIEDWIVELQPDYFIHTAALSRPMILHTDNPDVSIETNIIGTANVVLACMKYNIKLIYISTDYVYPGTDGNYNEESPLLPVNEYAWSKLGGECSVQLYTNSLIVRTAMVENPYPHPKALVDVKKSLISYNNAADIVLRLLDETGIINVGTESDTIYNHIKRFNPGIGKISLNDISDTKMASDSSMNIDKLKTILHD